MATYAVSFSAMMRKMFIILLISITTETLENSFLSYQYDFLLWHATRAGFALLLRYCALETLVDIGRNFV